MKKSRICLSLLTICLVAHLGAATPTLQAIGDPKGVNFPTDSEGRVYHLGLKKGELANRILLVGDPDRAALIKTRLDKPQEVFTYCSNRGFTTYTGTKNGVPVTIMSIGMGMPMMDFAIREIRAITEGPLAIIRLGSCGTPRSDIPIGSVVVASQSYAITTNYDAYHAMESGQNDVGRYFSLTSPLRPDFNLHNRLIHCLSNNTFTEFPVIEAIDATADSFYGSQGRTDSQFDDRNIGLIDHILDQHPDTGSLQMETFHLYHLALLNRYAHERADVIKPAACAIVLAQRKSDEFLSNERKHEIEIAAGEACLLALVHALDEMSIQSGL